MSRVLEIRSVHRAMLGAEGAKDLGKTNVRCVVQTNTYLPLRQLPAPVHQAIT